MVSAQKEANKANIKDSIFIEGDCRSMYLEKQYDAVICLYDVIGTYAENSENLRILENISRHLKATGRAIISVMNFELTKRKAKNLFSLRKNPGELLNLPASQTMEQTGNIFNPEYYSIDTETNIVYRKEQFASGNTLPVELIVRDRRFFKNEIENMCDKAGLKVVWSRCVSAGKWGKSLEPDHDKAKEILLLLEKKGKD